MTERLWDEIFNDFMAISQNRPILEWWWDNICVRVWRHFSGDSLNYWLTPDCSTVHWARTQRTDCRPGSGRAHWSHLQPAGSARTLVGCHVARASLGCVDSVLWRDYLWLCLQDHRPFANQHSAPLSGHYWARTVISVSGYCDQCQQSLHNCLQCEHCPLPLPTAKKSLLHCILSCRKVTSVVATRVGGDQVKIAGWGSYTPHPVHPSGVGLQHHPNIPMKFHDGGGGVMTGYHHHNLMDMYPGPAINTMDWKNTSQVGSSLVVITIIVTK